ncbi:SMP-30/gluconolactonase/LRE family protein [Mycolicibacterium sphagni]|uniref:SMP-30/gluconolactonase/LRE family protein n=1 Tax=Mycolicibacterium sphagni TaxID=1786 RepID=UPI0021F35C8F|nr:SMP-30/gluconolactonase/LRE family protein [Mycolicibacterium sphagni]MCV7177799.1 SMP-30/gluconolactonase/LRE family protein [Mycolicibacterium sphagni]
MTLHVLSDHRDALGEGPWWDAVDDTVYWVDSIGCAVHWARLGDGEIGTLPTPGEVGFVVKTVSGGLLAGCRDGLYTNDGASWQLRWKGDWDISALRVNDGKTDRHGRLWFGTMHDLETDSVAHLFSLDEGKPRAQVDGVTVSNGLGWSPDSGLMYYADSPTQTIRVFDYDSATGGIRNGRVFATDSRSSEPDGLTVDSEGCVWSAKWQGGKVIRYTPDGRIDREIEVPVSRPTSCMFVGSDLRTLAITSALPDEPEAEPLAGAVFLVDVGVQGLPEKRFDDRHLPGGCG